MPHAENDAKSLIHLSPTGIIDEPPPTAGLRRVIFGACPRRRFRWPRFRTPRRLRAPLVELGHRGSKDQESGKGSLSQKGEVLEF